MPLLEVSAEDISPIQSLTPKLLKLDSAGFYKGAAKLEWTPVNNATAYEVKITRTDKQTYRKFIVRRNFFHVMVFWEKPYVWQVKPLNKKNSPLEDYSSAFPLKVINSKQSLSDEFNQDATQLSKDVIEEDQAINNEPVYVSQDVAEKPMEVDEFPFLIKDSWFWLGTGYNLVSYDQQVDNFSSLDFQSFKGPTFFASGGAFLSDHYGFEASFKNTIGEIDNTQNGQSIFNYHWRIFTLETLYRLNQNLNKDGYIKGGQWILRAGLQLHSMPFLSIPNFSGLEVDLKSNDLVMAHGGFSYYFSPSPRLRYEVMLRYQHPVSANGDASFDVSPKLSFDGSLGFSYKLSDSFHAGAHWYGQWHQFNYEYGEGASRQSGLQELFFSNFDVRVGMEY